LRQTQERIDEEKRRAAEKDRKLDTIRKKRLRLSKMDKDLTREEISVELGDLWTTLAFGSEEVDHNEVIKTAASWRKTKKVLDEESKKAVKKDFPGKNREELSDDEKKEVYEKVKEKILKNDLNRLEDEDIKLAFAKDEYLKDQNDRLEKMIKSMKDERKSQSKELITSSHPDLTWEENKEISESVREEILEMISEKRDSQDKKDEE